MVLTCTPKKFCDTILRKVSDNRKGLLILNFIDKNLEPSFDLLVYKTSVKDPGLALNFCPWCGFKLSKRKDFPGMKRRKRK